MPLEIGRIILVGPESFNYFCDECHIPKGLAYITLLVQSPAEKDEEHTMLSLQQVRNVNKRMYLNKKVVKPSAG